jgi:hypothetical protein
MEEVGAEIHAARLLSGDAMSDRLNEVFEKYGISHISMEIHDEIEIVFKDPCAPSSRTSES